MSKSQQTYLLIDDEPVFNTIHSKLISLVDPTAQIIRHSVSVEALDWVEQAITEQSLPDYIFLDINMPEKNGFDVLEALAEQAPHAFTAVKFYILTSSLDERDRTKAMSFPFVDGFYSKPLTKNLLKTLID